jgi:hypothetical protein
VGFHCSFPLTLDPSNELSVKIGGIPHLAKNERDMGHPSSVREPGGPGDDRYSQSVEDLVEIHLVDVAPAPMFS